MECVWSLSGPVMIWKDYLKLQARLKPFHGEIELDLEKSINLGGIFNILILPCCYLIDIHDTLDPHADSHLKDIFNSEDSTDWYIATIVSNPSHTYTVQKCKSIKFANAMPELPKDKWSKCIFIFKVRNKYSMQEPIGQ